MAPAFSPAESGAASKNGRILVVDDETELMTALCEMLVQQNYAVEGFTSGLEALAALQQQDFDILLTDLMMPAIDGITLLRAALEIDPQLIGIVMTGQGTVATAVEAMKTGAFDYLMKPFKLNALLPLLTRSLDVRRLRLENMQLREAMAICEFNQAVSSILDTDEILNRIVDTARAEYQADEASILVPDADGESLMVAVTRGTRERELTGTRLPLTEGIAGWVARERQPLTLHGEVRDARFASLHPRPDIRHALCVPMLAGAKLAGVLSLNRLRQERPFTAGQVKAIKVFANTAAAALESARLHEQVRASDERYRRVLENVDEIVYMVEMTANNPFTGGPVMFVSPHVQSLIGYAAEEFIQDPSLWSRIIHPDDCAAVEAQTLAMYADRRPATREYRLRHKLSGEYRWMEDRVLPQFDATGKLVSLFGVARDVTERKHAEAEMRKLSSAVEQTADSVIITDRDGVIEYVNPAFESTTGYTHAEAVGRSPSLVKSGQHDEEFYQRLWGTLKRGESFRAVFVNRRKDGALYHEEKTISPLKDAQGRVTHYVSSGKDITARIAAEERLHHLAYHDSLTGLPNRALLLERLTQAMAEADRHERLVAVLFLDLDRFKNINDTLGHDIGDQLLTEAAHRLTATVRQGDTVARPGGDEFTVVLANVAHFDDVARVSQKIMEQFHTPFRIAGQDLFVTPSIGITLYPVDGKNPETLLKNADTAMYHAKDSGRNTFQLFTVELNQRMARQMVLEMGLRTALERDEFRLHYQPQVDLVSGGVTGAEALIRWQRGEELVSPVEFIPIAEDTGMIVPIGEWVLRTACAQAVAWQKAGLPPLKMSVNLSARQFREEELVRTIQRILQETGLEPARLMLEITESVIMHKPETVLEKLQQLDAMGVGLAVDDFGTGYSSLGYLKRFPIDSLKIDKSFVQDITTEPDDAAIAQAIISLARSLGIKVVAEGVETLPQLMFLRERHCDAMQGYYFSKPLPARDMTHLLHENRRLELPAGDVSGPERTLLIVDDEANIRKALLRTLRNEGYRILTADGPAQAFELLAQHPVGVILSDQRMPEMTGVEFLSRARKIYPQTVRIVLSGYTDLESVTNAINRGAIYKFLTKPWEDDFLREHVREAFRHYAHEAGSADQGAGGSVKR